MSDADTVYTHGAWSVHPSKLAYRGVLIERPCDICDTVDIHFEGRCNSGPCQVCGETERQRGTWHAYVHDHEFVYGTYYPADFEWPDNDHSTNASDRAQEAFIRILEKARELGEPELYTSDLFRDYQKLMGLRSYAKYGPAPVRFVWALRPGSCGTDLFTPAVGIFNGYTEQSRFFLYDGETHGPIGDFPECNIHTARTILSVWRQSEIAGRSPHVFVEGCCMAPEEAALHGSIVETNLAAQEAQP